MTGKQERYVAEVIGQNLEIIRLFRLAMAAPRDAKIAGLMDELAVLGVEMNILAKEYLSGRSDHGVPPLVTPSQAAELRRIFDMEGPTR